LERHRSLLRVAGPYRVGRGVGTNCTEPFRAVLTDNLPSGEFIRFLVHAPAFSTGAQNSPATVLAIGEKGWLVASENEDGGISVEMATFDEKLFVELASVRSSLAANRQYRGGWSMSWLRRKTTFEFKAPLRSRRVFNFLKLALEIKGSFLRVEGSCASEGGG
jgi:hypothetical protein